MLLLMLYKNQSGFAYFPIIILAVVIIAAGIYAAKGFSELKSPQFIENLALVYHSPAPSQTPAPAPSVVAKSIVAASKKPSASPSVSSSPSASPSPSNGSPSPTPTPQSGVYKLDCGQNCSFSMHDSQSYSVGATLADSNGKYLANQSDFEYDWSLDDSSFGSLDPFDTCMPGVNAPCPLDHAILNPSKHGSTMIRLKVKNKKDGIVAAETSFNVTVVNFWIY